MTSCEVDFSLLLPKSQLKEYHNVYFPIFFFMCLLKDKMYHFVLTKCRDLMRSTLLKHLRGKGAGDRGPQFAVAFHGSCWVSNIIFACQISFLVNN